MNTLTGVMNNSAQGAINTASALVNNELWQIIFFVVGVGLVAYIVMKLKGFGGR